MEFFKQNTKIDFMALRIYAALVSALLFILSIILLAVPGFDWGLVFTCVMQLHLKFQLAADITQIRDSLQTAGFKDAVVISYGTSKDVLITIAPKKDATDSSKEEIVNQVVQVLPGATVQQVDYIGPQVGQELATKGALAIVVALL